MVKSERAKERNLERVREIRRRKRMVLAKNKKYRSNHWIAKHAAENYDENEPMDVRQLRSPRSSRKKGGRGGRFHGSPSSKGGGGGGGGGKKRKRRFKVNPKYLKKYADQHQGDHPKSPRSPKSEDRVRDPEAYDARDRREWAMKRRPRGGSSKRRDRIRGKDRSTKPRRKKRNGFADDDHGDGGGGVDSVKSYSRKRGRQTWQRAR